MALPVIHLTGTPYDQGILHGRQLTDRIAHNLDVYFNRFEREIGLRRDVVISRASEYLTAIEKQNPDYYAGIYGISDGSGIELVDLAALNVRYEILYYQFGVNAMLDGCTAFAVTDDASIDGHLLLGQNWDWIPQVRGAILHTLESDGLETISFTEAGIVGGKIGLNNAGLGLTINGMTSTRDDWSTLRKPFHVRCYEILKCRDFELAVRVVTGTDRACSTNFLVAQTPNRVANIEAAPDRLRILSCDDGCLVHTNHFVDPSSLGVVEPPNEKRPHSRNRLNRLSHLIQAKGTVAVEDLMDFLRDHDDFPDSICRHPDTSEPGEDQYATVTSVIMDLNERTIHITDGRPCETSFETLKLTGN